MKKDLVNTVCKNVDGWLTEREGALLYDLAKKAEKTIVEIGSYRGRSTICMALALEEEENKRIFAIDPHVGTPELLSYLRLRNQNTYKDFLNNINAYGVQTLIRPLVMTSTVASCQFEDETIDLLFIDGSHEEQAVRFDFNFFKNKLKKGAILAFHDTCNGHPGVDKIIEEVKSFPEFKYVDRVDSLTYFEVVK